MENTSKPNTKFNWKVMWSMIFAFATYFLLIYFTVRFSKGEQPPLTYVTCILALILGWIAGIVSTPYNKSDEDKIGKFTSMIGAFLSGFLLSKFDKVIEEAISPEIVLDNIYGTRLLLFASYFFLTWIVVFVCRQYTWSTGGGDKGVTGNKDEEKVTEKKEG